VSTLRRAEPARRDRWRSPVALAVLILLRAVLYSNLGTSGNWTPRLSLVAIAVPFRSDSFLRMLIFSVLSIVVSLGAFYFCALLLSALNSKLPPNDRWQGYVRVFIGRFDALPWWLKLLLPFCAGAMFWLGCGPFLSWLGVQVPVESIEQRIGEAVLIGLGAWVTWKYVIAAVLVLHIVTSYVYLGNEPLWQYVSHTARQLLKPLSFFSLRIGRFDFAPVVGLAVVFAAAEALGRWLPTLYARLLL
jgi:uncharacterized protein YggT (Ycf19 family)